MELFPTLDIIKDYFTKSLQEYQFHRFLNIILGIREEYILSYNAYRSALLGEQNIKLEKEKEEDQKADKISGD